MSTDYFLIEAKFTDAKQYPLKRSTWEKIVDEAHRAGKIPLLQVTIAGSPVYVVPEHVVEMAQERMEEVSE